jgi:hypothetical protein
MASRGAAASDKEFDEITVYLAKSFPRTAAGQEDAKSNLSPPAAGENAGLFPPGPGRDLTVKVCSGCHAPELAAKQRLNKQDWSDLVQVMASRGAVATDKEFDEITAYLAKSFPADTAPKK